MLVELCKEPGQQAGKRVPVRLVEAGDRIGERGAARGEQLTGRLGPSLGEVDCDLPPDTEPPCHQPVGFQ